MNHLEKIAVAGNLTKLMQSLKGVGDAGAGTSRLTDALKSVATNPYAQVTTAGGALGSLSDDPVGGALTGAIGGAGALLGGKLGIKGMRNLAQSGRLGEGMQSTSWMEKNPLATGSLATLGIGGGAAAGAAAGGGYSEGMQRLLPILQDLFKETQDKYRLDKGTAYYGDSEA
jgi:hypothetical protein